MTQLQTIQQLVEEKGELMVMSDTGEKFELHKHIVKFDDSSGLVEVDGGTKNSGLSHQRSHTIGLMTGQEKNNLFFLLKG